MRTIHEQVRAAFEQTGWSVRELLEKSGLDIDRSSLARKLDGDLDMKTREAEALALTLRKHGFEITLTWPAKKSRRAA